MRVHFRRDAVLSAPAALALLSASTTLPACAGPAEQIRRAASVLPGYGPPDIAYPPVFQGRWSVRRVVASVATPLGEAAAPPDALCTARELLDSAAETAFDQRYVDTDGGIIADRGFNAEQRAAAAPGAPPLASLRARWDASNPNVLTLQDGTTGRLTETKVTKRSFESPGDGAFGTSEYARLADAGSVGVLDSVPVIIAARVQTRYSWDPTAASVDRIEALELAQTFDPTATGFADLAGATPVLTVKSRLTMTRSK